MKVKINNLFNQNSRLGYIIKIDCLEFEGSLEEFNNLKIFKELEK